MSDDVKKAALNAVQLLEQWSGDTVLPYSEFRQVHRRALDLNLHICNGTMVCLSQEEYQHLVDNQKATRKRS